MKCQICLPFVPAPRGDRDEVRSFVDNGKRPGIISRGRQRFFFVGVSLLLITCWMIASILLISRRLERRDPGESLTRQVIISDLYQSGIASRH